MAKIIKILIIFFIISFSLFILYKKNMKLNSFSYFYFNCNIFERSGKMIFKAKYHDCDYNVNGMYIGVNYNYKLELIDKEDKQIFVGNEHFHHQNKFSNDMNSILATTSEKMKFKNEIVRSDCVSRRNFQNQILLKWCLSDHIKELQDLGFKFKPELNHVKNVEIYEDLKNEISHLNSIHEIKKNDREKSNPVFSHGNYLINIHGSSGALIIIDSRMKNILWYKDMRKFVTPSVTWHFHVHDVQINSKGELLAFVNIAKPIKYSCNYTQFIVDMRQSEYSSKLMKFDPLNGKILWQYEDENPLNFQKKYLGTVVEFQESFFFTKGERGGSLNEVNLDNKIIWSYQLNRNEIVSNSGVMLNNDFLKSRKIIE